MRIRVVHETIYRYETPAKSVVQTLRMTPRSHDGQHVVSWRIDVDQDVKMSMSEDAFGNIVHVFTASGPIDELRVVAQGEVETQDKAGMLRGAIERFPAALFLRTTPMTLPDGAIKAFARDAARSEDTPLGACHRLMRSIHDGIALDADPKSTAKGLAEAFAARQGVGQDLTQIFIACARELGIPARYVSGHLHRGTEALSAGHCWAEAHLDGYGWIGFDPAENLCPTGAYVRVAVGLDGLGAAPIRGARYGGDGESLDVRSDVTEKTMKRQAQRQVQS